MRHVISMTAIDPAMATAMGSGRRRQAVTPAIDRQAAPTALRAMMSRRLKGSAIHCSSPRMARVAKARSSVTGGVMIGLMIIHAAMGSAVQLRRYQSGTTTRGVEAHLLQALMGWACLTKTQLRIEVDIPIPPRVRAKDRAAAKHPVVRGSEHPGDAVSEAQECGDRQRPARLTKAAAKSRSPASLR